MILKCIRNRKTTVANCIKKKERDISIIWIWQMSMIIGIFGRTVKPFLSDKGS